MSDEKLVSDEKDASPGKAANWRAQAVQLAAIVAVVFVAKGALAEPFYVPSGSMEPTLLIGDALLASKFPYGYGAASLPIQITLPETGRLFGDTPKRGDVVVFRWPGDRSQAWVKRVVGLPGDRIQLRQGQLFINDHAAALKRQQGQFRRQPRRGARRRCGIAADRQSDRPRRRRGRLMGPRHAQPADMDLAVGLPAGAFFYIGSVSKKT